MGLFADILGTLLNSFRIGKAGTSGNKTISYGSSAVALPNEPGIRWNEAAQRNQFSNDGVVWTNMSAGGGTATITQIEIDFGTFSSTTKLFTITDASVNASSNIVATQSGTAATGRHADENEMDPIIFSATPGSGQFSLIATPMAGPVGGKFKVNYLVG